MLLAAVLAGLTLALAAEDVITKASPGNEYVTFSSGARSGQKSIDGELKVSVKDEGTIGYHHKPYSSKKSGLTPPKKEQTGLKATIKDEGATGALLKEPTGNGVPPLKHISFSNNDKLNKKEEKAEESPDFEDTPLVPAASSQSSRINVKKGPNGQEYEYEYVYYYYDDEDEEGKGGAKTDKPAAGKTERPYVRDEVTEPESRQNQEVSDQDKEADIRQITRQEVRDEIRQDDLKPEGKQELRHIEGRRGEGFRQEGRADLRDEKRADGRENLRQDLKEESRQDLRYEGRQTHRSEGRHRGAAERQEVEESPRQRSGDRHEGRGHSRVQQEARPEEERRRRPSAPVVEDNSPPARTRYTTIERERSRVKSGDVAVTTLEPSSNEVLPTRSPSRGRQPVDPVEEERLPANTRFPGRSRGSATAEPPASRTRGSSSGGSGSLRRPSLVDSSSFRTHSSDAAPEEDQGGFLSSPVSDTRESDLEEYIRPTTFQPPSVPPTTLPPPTVSSSLAPIEDQEMPAKAALDLYAILQQTQEENSVVDSDYGTTDLPTTEALTTTPEPTTIPSTTTTTTTTTTPPPPSEPTKRGRFRGGGTRNRVRTQGVSTTTTTEASSEEEASQRPKFKPSHSRSPGQVSAYGRRRASGATSTTEATQQSTRARSSFQSGSNGNRYRARGRVSTTPVPVEEELPSDEVEVTSTTTKPRVRIGATAGARPLRPGPRLNLRPLRPGPSSSPPPPAQTPEAPVEQEAVVTTPEPAVHADGGDALTKLRSRPRLKVQPVVPQTRPFNNQRKPLIGLANRRRTTESEAAVETTTLAVPVETETPAPSSTEAQPHTTENKLASLIGRRRPINRRLPLQQAGDH